MGAPVAQESADLLQAQNEILELIARGATLHEILDSLLRAIHAHCPQMLSSILLLDGDGVHVRHGAALDLPEGFRRQIDGESIGPQAGSCGTAAFRREPVIVEDIATDPLWDKYRDIALAHNLRACWSTPILDAHRQVLGTFAMYFRSPGRPDARHLHLIEVSTHIAAIAICKQRAEDEATRREAQFVEAQRIATLGSYEWDIRSNRVRRSAELCRIFGLRPEEFEPTLEGYLARVHPDDRDSTRARIEAAFRERQSFDFEERIVLPDGSVRMLHSQGCWNFDEDQRPVTLVGICQDITERKEAEQLLLQANAALAEELKERRQAETQIQALTAQLIDAQEEERSRLARELHDDVGQQIAAVSVAASNLKREIRDKNAALQTERIQQKLIQLGESIRQLSHNLHPAVLEHSGIAAALRGYCSEFASLTGTTVLFQDEGSFEDVAPVTALTIYRIVQEALQNVLKHARVTEARVQLTRSSGSLCLTVADCGIGFSGAEQPHSQGLGLVSIKERTRLVKGTLTVESQRNRGTTLTVTIPI
jgi:PAS domain S-box-containing protein